MKYLVLFLIPVLLASCESKTVTTSVEKPSGPVAPPNPLPADFKFSMFISGSGNEILTDTGTKPFDSWTMDTNGSMNVRVARHAGGTHFDNLNAFAILDPPDMDSLRYFIRDARIIELDSNDLTQQCTGNEHYIVNIVPLSTTVKPVSLSFDACAEDYNLLLGAHRQNFKRFMGWWERMRIKYRPGPQ